MTATTWGLPTSLSFLIPDSMTPISIIREKKIPEARYSLRALHAALLFSSVWNRSLSPSSILILTSLIFILFSSSPPPRDCCWFGQYLIATGFKVCLIVDFIFYLDLALFASKYFPFHLQWNNQQIGFVTVTYVLLAPILYPRHA